MLLLLLSESIGEGEIVVEIAHDLENTTSHITQWADVHDATKWWFCQRGTRNHMETGLGESFDDLY